MRSYDFLVIGSGISGLGFALKVAAHGTVAVICKGSVSDTNTNCAQGGLSAVISPSDSPDQHIADTLVAGAGLCDEKMVRLLAEKAPECIQELQELGVHFTRETGGALDLGREGGHSRNRIVHTRDHSGKSIQEALTEAVKKQPSITLLPNHFAIDLLLENAPEGGKYCVGAKLLNCDTGKIFNLMAKAIMLATGGSGQVYRHTTNPAVATADGIAMASRAGAKLQDLEFVQFHPTALYDPGKPTFLISEAVRGFGAELKTPDGKAFMHHYHAQGSLAPRDVVARVIHSEMQKAHSPCVYLDLRHLPAAEIKMRFPKIYTRCLESALDLTSDLIPVVPAAHYLCGGVLTDPYGRTSIPNLYACGETACTGIHGANRLASNSLPEAWIFAGRAATQAVANLPEVALPVKLPETACEPVKTLIPPEAAIARKTTKLKNLMWQYAAIVRTLPDLETCQNQLQQLGLDAACYTRSYPISVAALEFRNMAQAALLIVEAALARKESRGCHYIAHQPFLSGSNIALTGTDRASGKMVRKTNRKLPELTK